MAFTIPGYKYSWKSLGGGDLKHVVHYNNISKVEEFCKRQLENIQLRVKKSPYLDTKKSEIVVVNLDNATGAFLF